MAMTDSGMSAVLELAAGWIFGHLREAIGTSPDAVCLPDIDDGTVRIRNVVLFIDEGGSPIVVPSRVGLLTRLHAQVEGLDNRSQFEYYLFFTPSAELAGELGRTVQVNLAYHSIYLFGAPFQDSFGDVDEALRIRVQDALNAAIRTGVEPLLDDLLPPISLDGLLPAGVPTVGAPEIKDGPSQMLLVGIALDGDAGVDRVRFQEHNPFPSGLPADAGALKVGEPAYRQMIEDAFQALDLEGHISSWRETTRITFFWRGEQRRADGRQVMWSDEDAHGHILEIAEAINSHDIWFAAEGVSSFAGFEADTYVVGFADLVVSENGDDLEFSVGLHARGWGALPLLTPDSTWTVRLAAASVPGTSLTARDASARRGVITVMTRDSRVRYRGPVSLVAPESVRVEFRPARPLFGLCGTTTQIGNLRSDGAAEKRFMIGHGVGTATRGPLDLLWICGIDLEDPDGVFSIDAPSVLPASIIDGGSIEVVVSLAVPAGDESLHEGALVIKSNYSGRPLTRIPLAGRIALAPPPRDRTGTLCVDVTEVPPQRWLDDLGRMIADMESVVGKAIPPGHELEVTIVGLPPDSDLRFEPGSGRSGLKAVRIEDRHYLAVPLERNQQGSFTVDVESWRGRATATVALVATATVGGLDLGEPVLVARFDRGLAYLLTSSGIEVVDIADPASPRRVASVPIDSGQDLVHWQRRLYVSADDAIVVFDVADPCQPVEHGRISISDRTRLHVVGDRLVAVGETRAWVFGLQAGAKTCRLEEVKLKAPVESAELAGGGIALVGPEGVHFAGPRLPAGARSGRFYPLDDLPASLRRRIRVASGAVSRLPSHHGRHRVEPEGDPDRPTGFRFVELKPSEQEMQREKVEAMLLRDPNADRKRR